MIDHPYCCRMECHQPAVVSIHESAPTALDRDPYDYTHSCADHVTELSESFDVPVVFRLREFPVSKSDWTPCEHCGGSGRDARDGRATCESTTLGVLRRYQCQKPAGHDDIHIHYDGRTTVAW